MADITASPLDVLIVEDEALLAMDLALLVEDCGHRVVGEAISLAEVEALPLSPAPTLAFVDIMLVDGSSGVDAATLLKQRLPDLGIVFVTANPRKIPDGFDGALGYVSKPFTRAGMIAALDYLAAALSGITPPPLRPSSFVPLHLAPSTLD